MRFNPGERLRLAAVPHAEEYLRTVTHFPSTVEDFDIPTKFRSKEHDLLMTDAEAFVHSERRSIFFFFFGFFGVFFLGFLLLKKKQYSRLTWYLR